MTVDLTNSGSRPGDEVAQLYVHERQPAVKRAAKELRGFQRVSLQPGERRTLTFTLPAERLAYYDEGRQSFVVQPGTFDVWLGSSSADLRARGTIEVSR